VWYLDVPARGLEQVARDSGRDARQTLEIRNLVLFAHRQSSTVGDHGERVCVRHPRWPRSKLKWRPALHRIAMIFRARKREDGQAVMEDDEDDRDSVYLRIKLYFRSEFGADEGCITRRQRRIRNLILSLRSRTSCLP
jgi:hypothetical protein